MTHGDSLKKWTEFWMIYNSHSNNTNSISSPITLNILNNWCTTCCPISITDQEDDKKENFIANSNNSIIQENEYLMQSIIDFVLKESKIDEEQSEIQKNYQMFLDKK